MRYRTHVVAGSVGACGQKLLLGNKDVSVGRPDVQLESFHRDGTDDHPNSKDQRDAHDSLHPPPSSPRGLTRRRAAAARPRRLKFPKKVDTAMRAYQGSRE